CGHCQSYIQPGLKRCPYCGIETQPGCPRCQAPVKPDWKFCPECTAPLARAMATANTAPEPETPPQPAPVRIAIRGSVVDGQSGAGISGASVKVDSRLLDIATVTDAQGNFELFDLEPRPYVLLAKKDGYSWDSKGVVPGSEEARRVLFVLTGVPMPRH
ncbi:MAG: carboxypeptidase regulatory-like domain-containing protein, partial [Armatimonadota bacterium]